MTSSWCGGTETDPSGGRDRHCISRIFCTNGTARASLCAGPGASLTPMNRGRTLPRTAGVVRFSALRGRSSDGRASAFQAECRRFDPGRPLPRTGSRIVGHGAASFVPGALATLFQHPVSHRRTYPTRIPPSCVNLTRSLSPSSSSQSFSVPSRSARSKRFRRKASSWSSYVPRGSKPRPSGSGPFGRGGSREGDAPGVPLPDSCQLPGGADRPGGSDRRLRNEAQGR